MVICLLAFASVSYAQATFSIGSALPTAADIGYTELTGALTVELVSGITVDSPFVITYSAPITNSSAADILVQGTGDFPSLLAVPELDRSANAIIVHIPAGATIGSSILISGVRVAIAGLDATRVTAVVDSPISGGNSIIVGQRNPVVISSIAEPFSSSPTEPQLTFGLESNLHTSFTIREGYQNAFIGLPGIGGQTVPTEFRINPFPSIPDGVQLTYNATAISPETGATLITQSGTSETVPRADGTTDVVFVYTPVSASPSVIESFPVSVTMTVPVSFSTAFTIQFQTTLIPIGAAVPSAQFPSTDIPRYLERAVPDETVLQTGMTELFFPFRAASAGLYTGVALTNPQNFRTLVTLTAYDDDGEVVSGSGISNPVTITLPRNGQYAKVASEIFGSSFDASSSGTIRAVGRTSQMGGFYMIGDVSGPGLDGNIGTLDTHKNWYLPLIFRQGSSPYNLLEIYNPAASEASITLLLFDSVGVQVGSATQTLRPESTLVRDVQDLFGISISSFTGGYIKGRSSMPLVVHSIFGNALDFSVLNTQAVNSRSSYFIPHFATGGPYATELTLVNVDTGIPAEITVTLMDDSGAALPIAGNPATITIAPKNQRTSSLADLFPALGPDLRTGSIQVAVRLRQQGPFGAGPSLIGAAQFQSADGSASTAIPLVLSAFNDFAYSHIAQNLGYFTGVVLLNTNSRASHFNLDVYSAEGSLVGNYSAMLQPGERIAKLVYELVPASAGQMGGYVRITSDERLTSFAFFGTTDIRTLSAIPPQNLR